MSTPRCRFPPSAARRKASVLLGLCLGLCCVGWASAQVAGDPQRGKALLLQRHETGCILCHVVPGLATGGEIGPPLAGLSTRYGTDELRARIADARQFNPLTVMPPYRSTQGLQHVAPAFQGKPVLTAQALEDIVSYLLVDVDRPSFNPPAQGSAPGPRTR